MTRVQSIWTLLKCDSSQYQFEPDVLCVICKTLLQNAFSGPCGCRYCYECISNRLNTTETYCPGNFNECQEEILLLNINTNKDPAINRKILKMIIKCPNESCSFTDELGNIERHIEVCNQGETIQEIDSDTKLLLENINYVKDEVQELKQKMLKLEENREFCINTIAFINTNVQGNQMQIWKVEENQNELVSQIKDINKKISHLTSPTALETIIESLNKKYTDLNNSIEEMKKNIDNKFRISDENSRKDSFEKSSKIKPFDNIAPNLPTEKEVAVQFNWVFEKFNEKIKEALACKNKEFSSNIFYTAADGYQMCLKLQFDVYSSGGTKCPLYQSLCVMKGKYDSVLFWPFDYNITFELINPSTNNVHTSQTIYNANSITHPGRSRPTGNINIGIGCFLIDIEEILNDPIWKKHNKFVINCIIYRNKR